MILYFLKNKIKRGFEPRKRGFFVLTMTLIVLTTVLVVATGIFLRSISELNQTVDSEKALTAWSTVNACGEYVLGQMATTTDGLAGWSYAGEQSVSVGDNTCYIYSIETSGTNKIIKASSTVSTFTRKIEISVATNTPNVLVNSWEFVADF